MVFTPKKQYADYGKPCWLNLHTGNDTCWNDKNEQDFGFISDLEQVIEKRKVDAARDSSLGRNDSPYIVSLFEKGTNKIAQKVGKEVIEERAVFTGFGTTQQIEQTMI